MKHLILIPIVALLIFSPITRAEDKRAALSIKKIEATESNPTRADIKATFGFVPTFLNNFPPVALTGAWSEFKSIQLNPKTSIPPKYKELIGLGVASQIPCTYCTTFHTQASAFHGATATEQQEAIAVAALERHWSTYLSGSQADMEQFKQMTDNFVETVQAAERDGKPLAISFKENAQTTEQAFNEMEVLFGEVPMFMRDFPKDGVVGAWNALKTLQMNPETNIPAKYKDLISLAVSAQIPCQYCVYFDTRAAQLDGATKAEINEAIAMASIVRQWSTVLNGSPQDSKAFKKELDQAFAYIKKNAA